MATRIYVGNLPYSADNQQLSELFGVFGEVVEATVVMDRDTGQSKGFGFVQMADDDAARNAIAGLNGTMLGNRTIRVNEAQARPERSGPRGGGYGDRPRGGGGYGRSGGGYGGSGDRGGYGGGGSDRGSYGGGGSDRGSYGGGGDRGGYGGGDRGGYGGGSDRGDRGGYGGGDRGGYGNRGNDYSSRGNDSNGRGGMNFRTSYDTLPTEQDENSSSYHRHERGRDRDRARRERDW